MAPDSRQGLAQASLAFLLQYSVILFLSSRRYAVG